MGYTPNGQGTADANRVTENDLSRMQEDLNRANFKVSNCTAAELRSKAQHAADDRALTAATVSRDKLQTDLGAAINKFHAQREEAERPVSARMKITDPLAEQHPASTLQGGFIEPGAELQAGVVTTADRIAAGIDADKIKPARTWSDLSDDERAEAMDVTDVLTDATRIFRLPSGETIKGGPIDALGINSSVDRPII